MAIKLEFFDIIIPIRTIQKKYPGGWKQCLVDHDGSIGGKVWYDEHLFRDGAMSPNDINYLVEWWSDKGFDAHDEGEKPKWLDFCVVQSIFGGPTLPCDWIEVRGRTAHLKNESIGHLVGSECKLDCGRELCNRIDGCRVVSGTCPTCVMDKVWE